MKKILSNHGGMMTLHHYDAVSDRTTFQTLQDCEPILEANKRQYNESRGPGKGDWHKVASIPLALATKWLQEENLSIFRKADHPKILRKLNDPNYRFLRTAPGRL